MIKKTKTAPGMSAVLLTAIALLVAFVSLPAWAAGGGEGGNNPFAGDVGNALWTTVIFIALLIVLGKFVWGPILEGLQKRERFIHDSLEQARKDREEAEAQRQEYAAKLAEARKQADETLEKARRKAAEIGQEIEAEARRKADETIVRVQAEIDRAKEQAVKDVYAQATQLATLAAGRILERELKPEDHERLVAESIDAISHLRAN